MKDNILLYSFLMLMLLDQKDPKMYQSKMRKMHITFNMCTKRISNVGRIEKKFPSGYKWKSSLLNTHFLLRMSILI